MFERVFNLTIPGNSTGVVTNVDLRRDDTGEPLWIEAWQTGGATNLYLMRGEPTTADAEAMVVGQAAQSDILCVIPAGAKARRLLPDDVDTFTVFGDPAQQTGAQPQIVTLRVVDRDAA